MAEEGPVKKKIDEAWKETVAREKKAREAKEPEEEAEKAGVAPSMEMDFSLFISGLGMQALMGLGEITDPLTKKKEVNLDQAKQTIDILSMLKGKTEGNLTDEESKILDNLLYELRMKYIDKVKGEGK